LDAAITAGRFREDLFYRLNVFPVQMPPLRDRLEDLPVLIEHLVQRQGQIGGRHIRLDKEAMNCLARNPWPGNVRELANLLERLAILYPEQTITASDLPERYRGTGAVGWFGSGVRLAPIAAPAANTASALLEQLLEAGETANDDSEDDAIAAVEAVIERSEYAVAAEMTGLELPRGGIDLKDHLSAIEIGLIRKALEEADGTVAGAARLLRMRRTTLVEKLRKYRLSA
jgi:sigma-54 specific flagellar transcriptional regulator A